MVQLVDREWQVAADFGYDFGDRRLNRVLERIENNHCTLDDLREIGINLWAGLMMGEVGTRFEALYKEIKEGIADVQGIRLQFCLTLPRELEFLPWEALYTEQDFGFVASHPDHCILRSPSTKVLAPLPPLPIRRKLRILTVIPSDSDLDVEHEWHNLGLAVGALGDQIHLERLSGRVDTDRLEEQLHRKDWDIVHFIGHGVQTEAGKTLIRLNSVEAGEDESWIEGERFASLFVDTGVRLTILNCCLGANPYPVRSLSGLGPFLLRAGLPAVVAMRYEISDGVAIRFSDKFYRELLNGQVPGRVDLAVERARRAIYQSQDEDTARAFVTPILFLAPGCEQLFKFEMPTALLRPLKPISIPTIVKLDPPPPAEPDRQPGAARKLRVFISYAREDYDYAMKVYMNLLEEDLDVWLDKESLQPGQRWKQAIEKAIEESDCFIALLSSKAMSRRGYVHKELGQALDILEEMPQSSVYLIPARLDECEPGHSILREIQWVDLFPDWDKGMRKILVTLRTLRSS